MVKNIVIVAGGKNSRFKEMSIFPKLLLPISPVDSILTYDMKLFRKQNVTVLMNEQYYSMTEDYVSNLDLPCKVVKSTSTQGSASSIYSAFKDLPKENVLFVWSDLILDDHIHDFIEDITEDDGLVYGTYNLDYRLGVDPSGEVLGDYHNLPGIYFAKDLNILFKDFKIGEGELDLAELFERVVAKDFVTKYRALSYTGSVLEFRDKETFLDFYKDPFRSAKPTARFFNQITVDGGVVVKKCVNEKYDKLIENEAAWYEELEKQGLNGIAPKFYSFDKNSHIMKIEYIRGKPVYDALSYENLSPIMTSILKNLDKLHSIKSNVDIKKDLKIELFEKPLKRCEKVSQMLVSWNRDITLSLLCKAWKAMSKELDTQACLVHGDLNMSNMIYSDSGEVKFIDPRGYFGNTKLYGSSDYDNAKVLYALSGFDKFNALNYVYYSKGVYDSPEDKTMFAPKCLNTKLNKLIVATIWISLTSYIGQDIYKANIAYEHGLLLLKKALEE